MERLEWLNEAEDDSSRVVTSNAIKKIIKFK
jgi:hypothetical protein